MWRALPSIAPANCEEDQLREARGWEQNGQQTASQMDIVWYEVNIDSGHDSEQAIWLLCVSINPGKEGGKITMKLNNRHCI